jgi:hypothetical protein
MTQVEQSIFSFKERMKATFYFATAPLNLLASLFLVDGRGEHGEVVRGISIFFGVISSPVLLLATPVTLTIGIIAGIAQAAFFPFQLFFSALKDVMPPSVPGTEKKSDSSKYDPHYDDSPGNNDVDKRADKHFAPLFTGHNISDESPVQKVTPEDNYFTP